MFRLARHCRQLLQVSCQSYTGQCGPEAGWAPQLEVHLGRDCVPVPLVQRGIWWEQAVVEKVSLIVIMTPDFPLSPPSLTLSLCLCVIYSMCLCVPFETMKWYRFWVSHRECVCVLHACLNACTMWVCICACELAKWTGKLLLLTYYMQFHTHTSSRLKWADLHTLLTSTCLSYQNYRHYCRSAGDHNRLNCTHCLFTCNIRTLITGQLEIVIGWLACTATHL